MKLQTMLNAFATDSFRNQADQDYIAARSNFKLKLRQQFLFSSLQAIEKYLKAILLFNGKKINSLGHNLEKLLEKTYKIEYLNFKISKKNENFILYLNEQGMNRYMSSFAYNLGLELTNLDETIWNIRRYCQKIPQHKCQANYFASRKKLVDPYYELNKHKLSISGGLLEKILARAISDQARQILVWKNLCYGINKKPDAITYPSFSSSEIPPNKREWALDHLELLGEYIKLPRT